MRRSIEFDASNIFKTLFLSANNQHNINFYFIGTCMEICEAVLQPLSGKK